MNKKTFIALLLCLVLSASLLAFPAFADGTVVIIGSPVTQEQTQNIGAQSALNSISAGNGSGTVVISGTSAASSPSSFSADTAPTSAVVVMPGGTVQTVTQQPASKTQTQTVVQGQQIQTASAQAAAASAPVVVQGQNQNTVQAAASVQPPAGLANDILSLINEKRVANGLSAVRYSDALQASADTRAKESAQNFSHLRPNGLGCETAVTVDYTVTGENLIQVTSEFATAAIMIDTWMNSPTHRNNILLSSFTDMAVGIYVSNGTTYVSTVFVG